MSSCLSDHLSPPCQDPGATSGPPGWSQQPSPTHSYQLPLPHDVTHSQVLAIRTGTPVWAIMQPPHLDQISESFLPQWSRKPQEPELALVLTQHHSTHVPCCAENVTRSYVWVRVCRVNSFLLYALECCHFYNDHVLLQSDRG